MRILTRASEFSVLAALTRISLARVRNSFAKNKSSSAIRTPSLQAGSMTGHSHRWSMPVHPKDRPSRRILTPAHVRGDEGVVDEEPGARGPPTARNPSTANLATCSRHNGKVTVAAFAQQSFRGATEG